MSKCRIHRLLMLKMYEEDSVQEMVHNEGDELVDIVIDTDNLDDFEKELPYEEEPPWA